jgi:hypothetical protein
MFYFGLTFFGQYAPELATEPPAAPRRRLGGGIGRKKKDADLALRRQRQRQQAIAAVEAFLAVV